MLLISIKTQFIGDFQANFGNYNKITWESDRRNFKFSILKIFISVWPGERALQGHAVYFTVKLKWKCYFEFYNVVSQILTFKLLWLSYLAGRPITFPYCSHVIDVLVDTAAIFDGNLDPYILCKSVKLLLLWVFLYEGLDGVYWLENNSHFLILIRE